MATKTKTNNSKKASVKTTPKPSVNKKSAVPTTLPEFIEGIPTQRRFKVERFNLINQYYFDLWRNLQRERQRERQSIEKFNYIHNDYLGVKVYINKRESDKKTIGIAQNHWKSTYAIKHLYDVVKYAKPLGGSDLEIDEIGSKTQGKNGYKKLLILYHQFINPKHSYLNFTVKLTIGVKANEEHVQYSVCKVKVE